MPTISGQVSVVAARFAIEDFKNTCGNVAVDLIYADFQTKLDAAANIASSTRHIDVSAASPIAVEQTLLSLGSTRATMPQKRNQRLGEILPCRDFSYPLIRTLAGSEVSLCKPHSDIVLLQGVPPYFDYRFKHAPEPDDNAIGEIRQVWLEYNVIFFRDQELPPAKFLAFAKRFGEVVEYPFIKGIEGFPEIIPVIKLEHETKNFGGIWHTDTAYLERPPMATMLIAREVPRYGGDTLFANTYLAYETRPRA